MNTYVPKNRLTKSPTNLLVEQDSISLTSPQYKSSSHQFPAFPVTTNTQQELQQDSCQFHFKDNLNYYQYNQKNDSNDNSSFSIVNSKKQKIIQQLYDTSTRMKTAPTLLTSRPLSSMRDVLDHTKGYDNTFPINNNNSVSLHEEYLKKSQYDPHIHEKEQGELSLSPRRQFQFNIENDVVLQQQCSSHSFTQYPPVLSRPPKPLASTIKESTSSIKKPLALDILDQKQQYLRMTQPMNSKKMNAENEIYQLSDTTEASFQRTSHKYGERKIGRRQERSNSDSSNIYFTMNSKTVAIARPNMKIDGLGRLKHSHSGSDILCSCNKREGEFHPKIKRSDSVPLSSQQETRFPSTATTPISSSRRVKHYHYVALEMLNFILKRRRRLAKESISFLARNSRLTTTPSTGAQKVPRQGQSRDSRDRKTTTTATLQEGISLKEDSIEIEGKKMKKKQNVGIEERRIDCSQNKRKGRKGSAKELKQDQNQQLHEPLESFQKKNATRIGVRSSATAIVEHALKSRLTREKEIQKKWETTAETERKKIVIANTADSKRPKKSEKGIEFDRLTQGSRIATLRSPNYSSLSSSLGELSLNQTTLSDDYLLTTLKDVAIEGLVVFLGCIVRPILKLGWQRLKTTKEDVVIGDRVCEFEEINSVSSVLDNTELTAACNEVLGVECVKTSYKEKKEINSFSQLSGPSMSSVLEQLEQEIQYKRSQSESNESFTSHCTSSLQSQNELNNNLDNSSNARHNEILSNQNLSEELSQLRNDQNGQSQEDTDKFTTRDLISPDKNAFTVQLGYDAGLNRMPIQESYHLAHSLSQESFVSMNGISIDPTLSHKKEKELLFLKCLDLILNHSIYSQLPKSFNQWKSQTQRDHRKVQCKECALLKLSSLLSAKVAQQLSYSFRHFLTKRLIRRKMYCYKNFLTILNYIVHRYFLSRSLKIWSSYSEFQSPHPMMLGDHQKDVLKEIPVNDHTKSLTSMCYVLSSKTQSDNVLKQKVSCEYLLDTFHQKSLSYNCLSSNSLTPSDSKHVSLIDNYMEGDSKFWRNAGKRQASERDSNYNVKAIIFAIDRLLRRIVLRHSLDALRSNFFIRIPITEPPMSTRSLDMTHIEQLGLTQNSRTDVIYPSEDLNNNSYLQPTNLQSLNENIITTIDSYGLRDYGKCFSSQLHSNPSDTVAFTASSSSRSIRDLNANKEPQSFLKSFGLQSPVANSRGTLSNSSDSVHRISDYACYSPATNRDEQKISVSDTENLTLQWPIIEAVVQEVINIARSVLDRRHKMTAYTISDGNHSFHEVTSTNYTKRLNAPIKTSHATNEIKKSNESERLTSLAMDMCHAKNENSSENTPKDVLSQWDENATDRPIETLNVRRVTSKLNNNAVITEKVFGMGAKKTLKTPFPGRNGNRFRQKSNTRMSQDDVVAAYTGRSTKEIDISASPLNAASNNASVYECEPSCCQSSFSSLSSPRDEPVNLQLSDFHSFKSRLLSLSRHVSPIHDNENTAQRLPSSLSSGTSSFIHNTPRSSGYKFSATCMQNNDEYYEEHASLSCPNEKTNPTVIVINPLLKQLTAGINPPSQKEDVATSESSKSTKVVQHNCNNQIKKEDFIYHNETDVLFYATEAAATDIGSIPFGSETNQPVLKFSAEKISQLSTHVEKREDFDMALDTSLDTKFRAKRPLCWYTKYDTASPRSNYQGENNLPSSPELSTPPPDMDTSSCPTQKIRLLNSSKTTSYLSTESLDSTTLMLNNEILAPPKMPYNISRLGIRDSSNQLTSLSSSQQAGEFSNRDSYPKPWWGNEDDVREHIKQGEILIKFHRRYGKPALRHVWVDFDESVLRWSFNPFKHGSVQQNENSLDPPKRSNSLTRFFKPAKSSSEFPKADKLFSHDMDVDSELSRSESNTMVQTKKKRFSIPSRLSSRAVRSCSTAALSLSSDIFRTFLLVLQHNKPPSRKKAKTATAFPILQLTCIDDAQFYRWFTGLQSLVMRLTTPLPPTVISLPELQWRRWQQLLWKKIRRQIRNTSFTRKT